MAALLAIGGVPSIARAVEPAAATPPPRPIQIDRNSVLILIRTTLVAVQQANQTGNYSVLYSISAPGFQSANSPERLSQIFAKLRAKKFDLSGVVVLEPQLLVMPEIYSNGVMRIAGFFPSVPLQVLFDLQFVPVEGQWRLVAISVDVGTSTPAAPSMAPAQSPAATQSPSVAPSQPPVAKGEAVQSPSVAPPQPTDAKPESAQSPSVDVNVKPKSKPTPTPTPRRKL